MDPKYNKAISSIQQLLAAARISKSRVAFGRSLKELSMASVFKNATTLHRSLNNRKHFQRLPPVLRRDFLKRLEAWAEERNRDRKDQWSSSELEQVFGLVQLLLDRCVTEFDFGVYGDWFGRDEETWRLLTDRCANLRQVVDMRKRPEKIRAELPVLPHLLRLKKLQHVKMRSLVCTDRDLAQLAQTLPGLHSLVLSVDYHHVNHDFRTNLFALQELEFLEVVLFGRFLLGVTAKFLAEDLMHECLHHLPKLQEAVIEYIETPANSRCFVSPNTRPEVLERPLALRTLDVWQSFKGWSCEMLPQMANLTVNGPLKKPKDDFLGFKNLSSLKLVNVDEPDMERFLRNLQGSQLASLHLSVKFDVFFYVDASLLFHCCPNLETLVASDVFLHTSQLHPVSAGSFEKLRDATLNFDSTETKSSSVQQQILMAPNLETLDVSNLFLDPAHVLQLLEALRKRRILQRVRTLSLGVSGYATVDMKKMIVSLLESLPAYAPELRVLTFREDPEDFRMGALLKASLLKKLRIPGFQFVVETINNWR